MIILKIIGILAIIFGCFMFSRLFYLDDFVKFSRDSNTDLNSFSDDEIKTVAKILLIATGVVSIVLGILPIISL